MILRTITAICLIVLVLFAMQLDALNFAIASGVLFALGALEWTKLCHWRNWLLKGLYLLVLFGAFIGLNAVNPKWVLAIASLFWLLPLYWVLSYNQQPSIFLKKSRSLSLIGLFILSTAWFAIYQIRSLEGPEFLLALFILVWSADTFAYFSGRIWGNKHLAPLISPKKTWAGFWGGLVGALVAGGFTFYAIGITPDQLPLWMIMALITVLLAVIGDLFESLIKRIAGVKDSGRLLPGHGGILDRIDSLLAALPFYAFTLIWLRGH